MFTGIVQKKLPIKQVVKTQGLMSFSLDLPSEMNDDLSVGASIAVNGVCLTVTSIDDCDAEKRVRFDVMQQSLDLSNLSQLSESVEVNVERSMTLGKEVGGHIVSGHIDDVVEIVAIEEGVNKCNVVFSYPKQFSKYILDKGFVALNGCSLTIASVDRVEHTLTVCFIPETLSATTFGQLNVSNWVNLEIDRQTQAIVDTVERVLEQKGREDKF